MKKILFLIIFLVSILIVQAQDFSVESKLITSAVYPGIEAEFEIIIKNNQQTQDTFTLIKDELASAPFSDKFEYIYVEPSTLDIPSKNQKKVTLKVKILPEVKPNKYYKTYIKVKNTRNEEIVEDILIPVTSPEKIIQINSSLPSRIVPGEKRTFSFYFKNSLNLILENVKIEISGDLVQDSFNQKFFPYQELSKEYNINLPSSTKPGLYKLNVKAYYNNKLRGSFLETIHVIENPNIKEKIEEESKFLLKIIKIRKTNYGNTVVEDSFSLPISNFQKPFIKSEPEPSAEESSSYEWYFSIKPDESYEIIIRQDYRLLAVIVLSFATILVLLSYSLTRKLYIKKAVFKVKNEKEGISELKVLLHVKNKGISLKNIQIIDTLPNLIKPAQDYGTLKPNKIQKGASGLRLIWELPELLTGEERIISYKIESSLHIIGKLILPRAMVKYRKEKKVMVTTSNKVIFISLRKKQ